MAPQTIQIQVPQLARPAVDGFAEQWRYNGLAIMFDDAHKQFALDFANIVLKSFVEQQARAILAQQQAQPQAAEAEAPKSVLVEG